MKILHTSDWHIGQSFYNYSRDEEHRGFIGQLSEIIGKEKPDVTLISGDLFDSPAPSIQAQKLMVEMIMEIHRQHEEMKIIITAGNHDSSSRLNIHSPLWESFNVTFITNPTITDGKLQKESLIVEIGDGNKRNMGFVVAVPFISEGNYGRYVDKKYDSNEKTITEFHQSLLDYANERNVDNKPVIMMGHIAVSGFESRGQDSSRLNFHPLSSMGEGYDYLALGHIHHPMTMGGEGNSKARYCGSPFPMSFDEDYQHSVTIVELDSHGSQPEIRSIAIKPRHEIVTYPSTPQKVDEVIPMIESLPDSDAYLRVNLHVEGHLPGNTRHRIESALANKNYRFCLMNIVRENSGKTTDGAKHFTTEQLRKIEPLDIAKEYYRQKYNANLPENFINCIVTANEQSTEEKRTL